MPVCEFQTRVQSRRLQESETWNESLDWRLASVYEPSVLALASLRLRQFNRCLGRQSQWRDRQSLCCRMASVHNLKKVVNILLGLGSTTDGGVEISEATAALTLTGKVTWAARWKLATRCCASVSFKQKRWEEIKLNWKSCNKKKGFDIYCVHQSYSSVLRQQIVGTSAEHKHFSFGAETRCVPQPETQQ